MRALTQYQCLGQSGCYFRELGWRDRTQTESIPSKSFFGELITSLEQRLSFDNGAVFGKCVKSVD